MWFLGICAVIIVAGLILDAFYGDDFPEITDEEWAGHLDDEDDFL